MFLDRILELDNLETEGRLNEELRKERNDVENQFDHAVFKENIMWRQKTEIQWAKERDGKNAQPIPTGFGLGFAHEGLDKDLGKKARAKPKLSIF